MRWIGMRQKIAIAVRFDADLLDRLDTYQSKLSPPVTRTAIIETAVQEWLDRQGKRK
jgi:predicted transcriptional regulator